MRPWKDSVEAFAKQPFHIACPPSPLNHLGNSADGCATLGAIAIRYQSMYILVYNNVSYTKSASQEKKRVHSDHFFLHIKVKNVVAHRCVKSGGTGMRHERDR